MGEAHSFKDIETIVRELFELGELVGESIFIEDKIPYVLTQMEDAGAGIDQTLVNQRQGEEDYVIPRWLGNLRRRLKETHRVYIVRDKEILDKLQRKGVEPENSEDVIQRTLQAIHAYTQAEVAKARAEAEAKYRQRISAPRTSPRLLDVAISAGYIEKTNGGYRFTQLVEGLTKYVKGMLTFDMLGKEELAIAELVDTGLLSEYSTRDDYETLMINMARPRKTGFSYVERVSGKRAFYRRTHEGIQYTLELIQKQRK